MHLQGRRWSGNIKAKFNVAKGTEYQGSIYDAGPTFQSYGVSHGSAGKYLFVILPFFRRMFLFLIGVCLVLR
jgi:hypothetical protein